MQTLLDYMIQFTVTQGEGRGKTRQIQYTQSLTALPPADPMVGALLPMFTAVDDVGSGQDRGH